MDIHSSVITLPSVGPSYAKRLEKLGILTVLDLLYHLPARYEDYSLVSPIFGLQRGETVTVQGTLDSVKTVYTRRGKQFQEAHVTDSTGSISIIWFNQPFLTKSLKPGVHISLSGKVDEWNKKPALISPDYELIQPSVQSLIHTGRLVPVYPETYGLSSKWLRSRISSVLHSDFQIIDPLPQEIVTRESFPDLINSFKAVHFPDSLASAQNARQRLAFDELFYLSLTIENRKHSWKIHKSAHQMHIDYSKLDRFFGSLPFTLTPDQKTAIDHILTDLSQNIAMNRILEGDVGSGKTVVAAAAALVTGLNNKKTLFMAPTQILSTQHHHTLTQLLKPHGMDVGLVTSGLRKDIKKSIINFPVIVGTHALLHQKHLGLDPDIGLVVIDEQHRFGVEQRSHFLKSKPHVPHVLTMTATPIPRTVALTLYGDLDLSQIKTLPQYRKKVTTWVVPPEKRDKAYLWIRKTLQENKSQAFIICPFIEPSESMATVKSATTEFNRLSREIFPDLKLALLHGKIKPADKDRLMQDFKAGEYDILVATPVVEVGIDIPTANIILIEDADKFGLASLHQLRGRVGRGNLQSFCLLFTQTSPPPQRLKALEYTHSGITLAEIDLKTRGPGDIYGTAQHGFWQLKIATYQDLGLIEKSKSWASKIYPLLDKYPALRQIVQSATIPKVEPN